MAEGHPIAPAVLDPADPSAVWPASDAAAGRLAVVDLASLGVDLPQGEWPDPPAQALVASLSGQAGEAPYGFVVAGLNPYRPLDDACRAFAELIAGQVAASVASARAYEAERRRAEALAELDEAKTTFFTNVSHELRTPLTLILGPVEEALADSGERLSPAQRERVLVVQRNAERLLELVNDLLDFSKLTSHMAGHAHALLRRGVVEPASAPAGLRAMQPAAVAEAVVH